jgi:regulatory protein
MNPNGRQRRAPRKATATYLERAAMFHLQRFSTTSSGLRRVLLRRVQRSVRAHGTDLEEGRALVDSLIARLLRCGLLDDHRFALARAKALFERGSSFRGIALRLKAKGVPADEVHQALATLRESAGDGQAELEAAVKLARKRRLGPYREQDLRLERRQKDLAVLVRAGFPFSLARAVIEGERREA